MGKGGVHPRQVGQIINESTKHSFGMWGRIQSAGGNLYMHEENMQDLYRGVPAGIRGRAFWLWGQSASHYTTVQPHLHVYCNIFINHLSFIRLVLFQCWWNQSKKKNILFYTVNLKNRLRTHEMCSCNLLSSLQSAITMFFCFVFCMQAFFAWFLSPGATKPSYSLKWFVHFQTSVLKIFVLWEGWLGFTVTLGTWCSVSKTSKMWSPPKVA